MKRREGKDLERQTDRLTDKQTERPRQKKTGRPGYKLQTSELVRKKEVKVKNLRDP